MKYLKYTLVFTFILTLFLFGNIVYARDENSILYFYKLDDQGHAIKNASFTYKTIGNEILGEASGIIIDAPKNDSSNDNEEIKSTFGEYSIDLNIISYEDLYGILTTNQKSVADKMTNMAYYNSIAGSIAPITNVSFCSNKTEFINLLNSSNGIFKVVSATKSSDDYIRLNFYSFIIIEETFTPDGFEKETMVLPVIVNFSYLVNEDNTLSFDKGNIEPYNGELLKYDSSLDYNNPKEVFEAINDNMIYENHCENYLSQYSCRQDESYNCGPKSIVVDKTSTEDLSISVELTTLINGKNKTTLEKNKEATIQVELTNNSRTPLHNNSIITHVPKGLVYVSSSADNNGQYNEEANTITWNLNYLDASKSVSFSYKASVPSDANNNEVYSVNSTLNSTSLRVPKVSNNATADLTTKEEDKNPDTGDYRKLTLLCVLALAFVALYIAVSKAQIREF